MKTVLLTVPLGMSARNILRSDVYRLLRERCRLAILSPLSRNDEFVREFAAANAAFYELPLLNGWRSYLRSQLQTLWTFDSGKKTGSETLLLDRERMIRTDKSQVQRLERRTRLLNYLRAWRIIRAITSQLIFRHPYYSGILNSEKPDLVMTANPLTGEPDLLVMCLARRRGIPTIGFVHSWDNIPDLGNPWVLPDKLIVWNHIMKEQAIHFLGFPEESIFVVGIPQYDEYLFNTPAFTRAEYLTLKGIPQGSRIITYACGNPRHFPDEEEFIRDLISLVNGGEFGDAVLLLRLHPRYNVERFKQLFSGVPSVFMDEPSEAFGAGYTNVWPKRNDNPDYVNLLKHSDVVINLGSTVTIDAAIFDKPVVNIAYSMNHAKDPSLSYERYYETSHYKNIVASGGARIAYNREQLVQYLKMYLENPSADSEGRKRLVAEQCYRIDGKAGERIVEAIFKVIR